MGQPITEERYRLDGGAGKGRRWRGVGEKIGGGGRYMRLTAANKD